jgi:hypothetical protein
LKKQWRNRGQGVKGSRGQGVKGSRGQEKSLIKNLKTKIKIVVLFTFNLLPLSFDLSSVN